MTWSPMSIIIVTMAVSGALTMTAVTIIAAIKGSAAQAQALAAQTQANANQQAIGGKLSRVQIHDQQLNTLALQVPPPSSSPAQPTGHQ